MKQCCVACVAFYAELWTGLSRFASHPQPPSAKRLSMLRTTDGQHLVIRSPLGPVLHFPHQRWWPRSKLHNLRKGL